MRFRWTRQHKIALAIYTASQWHSDSDNGGKAMLSLSSTRKIHTEKHRQELITEIVDNIRVCVMWCKNGGLLDLQDNLRAIRRLTLLWEIVASCKIEEEWLSFEDNDRLNEELYQAGKLA